MAILFTTISKRRAHDMTWPSKLLGVDDDCLHFLGKFHSRIRKFKDAEINTYSAYRSYIKQQNVKILNDISGLLHQTDEPANSGDILSAINYSIPEYTRLHSITGISWTANSKARVVTFISAEEQKTIERLCGMGLIQYSKYKIQPEIAANIASEERLEFIQLRWIGFVFMKIVS